MIGIGTGVWIGFRYLGSRSGKLLSLTTIASTFGLILGVAVLILVMSVMNGLYFELRGRLLGVIPHIEIMHDQLATMTPTELLGTQPELAITGAGPFIRFEALAKGDHQRNSQSLSVMGIDSMLEAEYSLIPKRIVSGNWQDLEDRGGIVMGFPLADYLGLFVGSKVTLLLLDQPHDRSLPNARQMTFKIVGLFTVGAEVDYNLAFISLADGLATLPATAYRGGWSFRLPEPLLAPQLAPRLASLAAATTGIENLQVRTWADVFGGLFRAVRMEKVLMFSLLMLIVALSTFSIAATLALAVDQKRAAVAILTTMGMAPAGIMLIFLIQGLVIAIFGTGFGVITGMLLAEHVGALMQGFEELSGIKLLQGTFFESLPAVWQWGDLLLVAVMAILLTLASTIYPAMRAARAPPSLVLNQPN